MRIGAVEIASNLLLSPIAGYCDLAFRLVVRPQGGLGLACTDLLNPRGLKNRTARSMQIARTCPEDQPLAIQLYGTDGDELAEAGQWAAENGACIVDINMGCPVKKVAARGGGSGLLRCGANAVELAEKVVRACPAPVTVKTRLGWEMGALVAPDLVRRFEDVGVAAVTIHGRYGEQRFRGAVDLPGIRAVAAAARSIPVFGNGDVKGPEDAKRMIDQTGCDGVMIGRRALADAWIFRDTHAYLTTGIVPAPPSKLERMERMIEHFRNMIRFLGERHAVVNFRKWMTWYSKTIGPCPKLRRGIPLIHTVAEFDEMVGEFIEELRHAEQPAPTGGRRATTDILMTSS